MIEITSSWDSSGRDTGRPSKPVITCSYGFDAPLESMDNSVSVPQRFCSSVAEASNVESCTSRDGVLSLSMYSSSVTVSRQLRSTHMAPVRAHANWTSKNSTPLWARSATRSPRPMPSETR